MTQRICLFLLVICFALSAQDDGINWMDSYPEARKIAKEKGKPIFVEFRCEA